MLRQWKSFQALKNLLSLTECQVTPKMFTSSESSRIGKGVHHGIPASLSSSSPLVSTVSEQSQHDEYPSSPVTLCSSDREWEPSVDSDSSGMPDESQEEEHGAPKLGENFHKEPKYIVFSSCLQELLQWCHCISCGSVDIRQEWNISGTLLFISFVCDSCDRSFSWASQPRIGKFPGGNILLSAGILFAGASVTKVLRVLQHMGVMTHTARTFFHHQREILYPAIEKVWQDQQAQNTAMLQVLAQEGRPVICGGDGRADSPGHSAKYGTYTTMELELDIVLDLQVVQVRSQMPSQTFRL